MFDLVTSSAGWDLASRRCWSAGLCGPSVPRAALLAWAGVKLGLFGARAARAERGCNRSGGTHRAGEGDHTIMMLDGRRGRVSS